MRMPDVCWRGIRAESMENRCSVIAWNFGMRSVAPNPAMMMTETILNVSAEMPKDLTSVERKSVKKVKLAMNPMTIAIGRFLSPVIDPLNTIGRMGKMHGERIVTNPARKAKKIRSNT